jgi:exonuclease SbcD
MKILHTADWHLGQKFLFYDRELEHKFALNWLLEFIQKEKVETLIVAGDIFDIGNPPNYARKMYYQFLTKLQNSDCRHVIITGGNHDSPAMLNAPKDLLEALNVHVIGAATADLEDEIIVLKNPNNEVEAVIAAVPFLRDRDLRTSLSGESSTERITRIKEGIYHHYAKVANFASKYKNTNVPIIATGHLYAKGALSSAKQDNIYIGNLENIEAEEFPKLFNYVALGHLHRAQIVGGMQHIRYSGSILPLSFSEIQDEKSVNLIHFKNKKIEEIKLIPIPVFRQLVTVKGSFETVQKKLDKLAIKFSKTKLPAWVEVIIETKKLIPNLDNLLNDYTKEMNLELLKIRTNRQLFSLDNQTEQLNLDDLDPVDVFKKKCASFGSPPDEMKELLATFNELENWMREEEL